MEALKATTRLTTTGATVNRQVQVVVATKNETLAEMEPTEIEEVLASLDGRNLKGHVRLRNQVERGLKVSHQEVTRLTALAQRLEADLAKCHQELGQAKQNLKGYKRLERAFAVLDALTAEEEDDQNEAEVGSAYLPIGEAKALQAHSPQPRRELAAPNKVAPLGLPAPQHDSSPVSGGSSSSNSVSDKHAATSPNQAGSGSKQTTATSHQQGQGQRGQSGVSAELVERLCGLGRRLTRYEINLSGFEMLCRQTLSRYRWGYDRLRQAESRLNEQARLLFKKKLNREGFEAAVSQILEEIEGSATK